MTEQQRLRGLLILSAMQETLKRVRVDFAELEKAADEFRADFERWEEAARAMSTHRSPQSATTKVTEAHA